MQLLFQVVLQIACMLQAQASASIYPDDVIQQTNLRTSKVQSNVTNNEKNLVLETNEPMAQAQYNQLSLIVHFAGTGYNLVRGNPEGDFNYGGVDPGVRTTYDIFAQTYTSGKKVYYLGKTMQVPDQVNFVMSHSCAESHTIQAYSGSKSYMQELEASVSVSGGYTGLFSVSFSLSAGMARAKAMTQRRKQIVIQKNKICNYGRARYLYENAAADESGYSLSESFKNSVKYQLPTQYNKKAYMKFIEKWGTHIIITVDVGTREILRSSSTYTEVYNYLKQGTSLSTRVKGKFGGYRASAGFSIKTVNENINQNTKLGKSWRKITIGSKGVPQPIHIDLKLITKALDTNWWGGMVEWRKLGIKQKQKNLMKALKEYAGYVHARKNTDPLIKFKIHTQWPDGTYALPAAKWGCPHGWSRGWTFQDTENKWNRKSHSITSKMKVDLTTENIRFHYCVKTFHGNSGTRWPKGTYCIAKKGKCPHNFRQGGIKWDDDNRNNKNQIWGVLPDGVYNKDTIVNYCCRSDANYNTPMTLPTTRPFILYRYGGKCQNVRGMHKYHIWIQWDDEDHRNKDACWGARPDSNCKPNQLVRMCYYRK